MSKAVLGAAEIAGAIVLDAVALTTTGGIAAGFQPLFWGLLSSGVATEAGAIAQKLSNQGGIGITTRAAAGYRQIIRGKQRVGGTTVYESTTGTGGSGGNYLWNFVIALASHEVDGIENIYVDGRQVFFKQTVNPQGFRANMGQGSVSTPPTTSVSLSGGAISSITASGGSGFGNVKPVDGYRVKISGNGTGAVAYATNSGTVTSPVWTVHVVHGGSGYTSATAEIQGAYTFGGTFAADQQDSSQPGFGLGYGIGPNGLHYNFDGKGYCEVRWGDQPLGDTMASLNRNDGAWSNGPSGAAGGAQIIANINPISHQVVSYSVVSGGSGFTSAPSLSISGGGGSGATATAIIQGGRIVAVSPGAAGTGYTSAPNVNISAPSTSSSPSLCGIAYLYLNIGYDATQFTNVPPEIRITINGKNNIFDPRTGKSGFTNNWGLQVADVITDPVWGLGDNTVNQAQLIAAANICDQSIASAGGIERLYTSNYHHDSTQSPMAVLDTMMTAADGRVTRVDGEWFIFPAAWQGSSFSLNESCLVEPIRWKSSRPIDQLANRITGTYIAPVFPYSVAGNLYDRNGWWNGTTQTNFNQCWEPTSFPQVAIDVLHGFGSDILLAEDGGLQLPKEVNQQCVLSLAQCQRVGFIMLLRNRQQGTGTLKLLFGTGFQIVPNDVIQFTSPTMGWVNKYLEISSVTHGMEQDANGTPYPVTTLEVQETDPTVYAWSAGLELTAYDQPAFPGATTTGTPNGPTAITIEDDSSTALVTSNGTSVPRALVSWTPPDDIYVAFGGSQQIQYQFFDLLGHIGPPGPVRPINHMLPLVVSSGPQAGLTIYGSSWIDFGTVSGTASYCYIDIPNGETNISVQIRSVRANGATSPWVADTAYTGGAPHLPTYPIPVITSGGGTTVLQYSDGTEITALQPQGPDADNTAQNGVIMLQNPMFAAGNFGWSFGTGWSIVSGTPAAGSSTFVGQFHSTSSTTSAMTNGQIIPCAPGAVVAASCFIKPQTGTTLTSSQVRINFFGGSGLISTISGNLITATGSYVNSRGFGTAPTGTTYAEIDVAVFGCTGTVLVSNFGATYQSNSLDEVPSSNTRSAYSAGSGASENIVPNGNFALGDMSQWQQVEAAGTPHTVTFGAISGINCIQMPTATGSNGYAWGSATFAVMPGRKYRIIYTAWATAGTQDTYLRINYSSTFGATIGLTFRTGFTDFLTGGSLSTTAGTQEEFEWLCPAGVNFASVAVYNWTSSTATVYIGGISVNPYAGSREYNSDQTGNNIGMDSQEMLVNPNFENGTTGWTLSGSASLDATPTTYYSGQYSMKIPGGGSSAASQTLSFLTGHIYQVSGWIKAQGNLVGGGAIGAGIVFGDTSSNVTVLGISGGTNPNFGGTNPGVVFGATGGTNFTQVQFTFSVNANVSLALAMLSAYGGSGTGNAAWFDALSVIDLTAAQTLASITDSATRFAAVEGGANNTAGHVPTAYATGSSDITTTTTLTAIPSLGFSVVSSGTSNVYNVFATVFIFSSGGSTAAVNIAVCVDGTPAVTYTYTIPPNADEYIPVYASVTSIAAGSHTIQLYASNSGVINGVVKAASYAMAQRIY